MVGLFGMVDGPGQRGGKREVEIRWIEGCVEQSVLVNKDDFIPKQLFG